MEQTAIIFPGIAMFFLTASAVIYMGIKRHAAIQGREVSIAYYRLFNEGNQPARLQLISRHVQNHFEVPPLFYIVVLFLYVSGTVTPWTVTLAWLYVVSRCVHSYIHLGSNNVSQRFFVFGASGLVLVTLWGSLLVSLLTRST
jgi:hypothetical protein